MRILPTPSRARGRIWAGCLLVAAVIGAVATGPAAVAAPASPAAAGAGTRLAASAAGTPSGQVTWSVVPATSTGPDQNRLDVQLRRRQGRLVDPGPRGDRQPQQPVRRVLDLCHRRDRDERVRVRSSCWGPARNPPTSAPGSSFAGGARQLSTIIPGKKAIIVAFTLNVPRQATPGDHTGAMVAAVGVTRKNAAGENVVENYRIAVPLELRVPGALQAGLQVQSISTGFSDPLNPFGTGSATVSYTLTNTGNVRQSATPTVNVTGPFGQTATVHPAKLPMILPGDSVRVSASLPGLFPGRPDDSARERHAGLAEGDDPAGPRRAGGDRQRVAVRISVVSPRPDPAARGHRRRHLVLLPLAASPAPGRAGGGRRAGPPRHRAAPARRAGGGQRPLSQRHSANGHSANGDGAKPPAAARRPRPRRRAEVGRQAEAASAEAAAPGGTPDGGGTATEGTTE